MDGTRSQACSRRSGGLAEAVASGRGGSEPALLTHLLHFIVGHKNLSTLRIETLSHRISLRRIVVW